MNILMNAWTNKYNKSHKVRALISFQLAHKIILQESTDSQLKKYITI